MFTMSERQQRIRNFTTDKMRKVAKHMLEHPDVFTFRDNYSKSMVMKYVDDPTLYVPSLRDFSYALSVPGIVPNIDIFVVALAESSIGMDDASIETSEDPNDEVITITVNISASMGSTYRQDVLKLAHTASSLCLSIGLLSEQLEAEVFKPEKFVVSTAAERAELSGSLRKERERRNVEYWLIKSKLTKNMRVKGVRKVSNAEMQAARAANTFSPGAYEIDVEYYHNLYRRYLVTVPDAGIRQGTVTRLS